MQSNLVAATRQRTSETKKKGPDNISPKIGSRKTDSTNSKNSGLVDSKRLGRDRTSRKTISYKRDWASNNGMLTHDWRLLTTQQRRVLQ